MTTTKTAFLIRLIAWLTTVFVTIGIALLLVDSSTRTPPYWLTVGALLVVESLWAAYPVVRSRRTLVPLPIATTLVLLAYTVIVAALAVLACLIPVSFNVLLALHLAALLLTVILPLAIVLRGGLLMSTITQSTQESRTRQMDFRSRFRRLAETLKLEPFSEMTVQCQLATDIQANLRFAVTESLPATCTLDETLEKALTTCEDTVARLRETSETSTTERRDLATSLTESLQRIKQTLNERDATAIQQKR
jgi:hypothetical protein